jgi:adenine-specific DNA-methyltransferase
MARLNSIASSADYVVWYARDLGNVKYRQLFLAKEPGGEGGGEYTFVEIDGDRRPLTLEERRGLVRLPERGRLYRQDNLTSGGHSAELSQSFTYDGRTYTLRHGLHWKTTRAGLERLAEMGRLERRGVSLSYVRFLDDFPVYPLVNVWQDTSWGFGEDKLYVVQTAEKVIGRCLLMTTDPGDLVLDPTCGSGTTAYSAEQWGRRWITVDTSRVPLALARQRLLTATFAFYALQDPPRGPAAGFIYARRQNSRGEEVGGIVPHITLKSLANDEPPQEEVLVDRPEVDKKVTRVTGPFVVEATIPTPVDIDGSGIDDSGDGSAAVEEAAFADRMLEVLRRNPVLQLRGKQLTLKNVRQPATTLSLSAEAALEPNDGAVALVFGPENGAVSEKLVYEASREAHAKSYEQLIVIGFAIDASARDFIEKAEQLVGIPATYVQATPDLVMGDLLKTMRSSQIFSVAGLPDITIHRAAPEEPNGPDRYQVELLGLDVFDPTTMDVDHEDGGNVPAGC